MDDESKLLEVDARIRAALLVDGVASRRVVMRALADDGRRTKEVRRRPFSLPLDLFPLFGELGHALELLGEGEELLPHLVISHLSRQPSQ